MQQRMQVKMAKNNDEKSKFVSKTFSDEYTNLLSLEDPLDSIVRIEVRL